MQEIIHIFTTAWWGILILCSVATALWLAVSVVFYRVFFKRFYDFVFSLISLIMFSPLLLLLTIAGAIMMKGNPFFAQKRPGKNGKVFKVIKFRTMTNERNENGIILPDEKRLNRYGKFIRSYSLDELPQLINILKGDMSYVGPRPQLIKDLPFFYEEQVRRQSVRPGLTGLAQVNGRNVINWEKRLEYDLEYINNITLFGDIKIIIKTAYKVLFGRDTTTPGMETSEDYGDYLLRIGKISREEYDQKILAAQLIK